MSNFSLKGKTALITGGGSGIGKAIATTFANQGAKVHIFETDSNAVEQTVSEIQKKGNVAAAHIVDVTEFDQINTLVQSIAEKDSIDVLVNNAGIAHIGTVESTAEADFDRLFSVNVKGVFNCTKACIPYMKNAGKAAIVNMASIAGSIGIKDRFAYSMTKGAVLAMTYSIAKDFLEYNIRCNSIATHALELSFEYVAHLTRTCCTLEGERLILPGGGGGGGGAWRGEGGEVRGGGESLEGGGWTCEGWT